jgi:hypothetical protein
LALVLIVAGRVRGRFRRHRWAVWACLGLGAVLLYRLPPLDSLLVSVPPISSMTLPRFGMLVAWGLAVWAALAVDGALRGRIRGPAWRLAMAAVVAAVALSGMPWRLVPVDLGLVLLTIVGAVVSGSLLRWPAALGCTPSVSTRSRHPRIACLGQIWSSASWSSRLETVAG